MYAPSNLAPEFLTIDASTPNSFTWDSNVLTQYAYQLKFYNNLTNVLLFDSTQVVSSTLSYELPASSLANNLEVKWYMTQWESVGSYIDSEYILIKTAIAPVVTIPSTPFNTQSFTFNPTVTLAPNTTIQKYRFILYDSLDVIVDDTSYVYGLVPSYDVIGLVSGDTYKIQIEVVDQNNQSGFSALTSFVTNYTTPNLEPLFITTVDDDVGSVLIDWTNVFQFASTPLNGDYSFVAGKFGQALSLDAGNYLQLVKTVPIGYTLTFYVKLDPSFTGNIVMLDGTNDFTVFYNGTRFGFSDGDFMTVGSLRALPNPSEFIKIGIKYDKVIIETSTYTEIIF